MQLPKGLRTPAWLPAPCPAVHPGVCQAENEVCPPPRLQYPPHADDELPSPQGNVHLLLPPTGHVLVLEPGWGHPSSTHTELCVLPSSSPAPTSPHKQGSDKYDGPSMIWRSLPLPPLLLLSLTHNSNKAKFLNYS